MSLKLLRQQAKTLLEREAKLTAEERSCFSWQLMYSEPTTDTNYLIGKGGSHTCFYIINPTGTDKDERVTCLPMDLLDVISSWGASKYSFYGVGRSPSKFKRFTSIEKAQKFSTKKLSGKHRLFGVKKNGDLDILFKLETTLAGTKQWVAV